MKAWLGMIYVSYYYGECEPSNDKDDHHISKVKTNAKDTEDENDEVLEPPNQLMTPSVPKFMYISGMLNRHGMARL